MQKLSRLHYVFQQIQKWLRLEIRIFMWLSYTQAEYVIKEIISCSEHLNIVIINSSIYKKITVQSSCWICWDIVCVCVCVFILKKSGRSEE
jgi:hypothetical protein